MRTTKQESVAIALATDTAITALEKPSALIPPRLISQALETLRDLRSRALRDSSKTSEQEIDDGK